MASNVKIDISMRLRTYFLTSYPSPSTKESCGEQPHNVKAQLVEQDSADPMQEISTRRTAILSVGQNHCTARLLIRF
jgi:hypothetical protein